MPFAGHQDGEAGSEEARPSEVLQVAEVEVEAPSSSAESVPEAQTRAWVVGDTRTVPPKTQPSAEWQRPQVFLPHRTNHLPGSFLSLKFFQCLKQTHTMSELVIRQVDAKVDEVLDQVSAVDPRIAKVIEDLDLKEIDWTNPLPHALRVSAYIQTTYKGVKGADKLTLLKDVLKALLSKTEISEEERSTATRFVDEVLPVAVSAAVMVAKGEVDLKKVVAKVLEDPGAALEQARDVVEAATPYCLTCWGFLKRVVVPAPRRVQTTTPPLTTNPLHTPVA